MSRRSGFAEPDGVGEVTARVEPELVGPDDPLANIDRTTNALFGGAPDREGRDHRTERRANAGQGVFSDLIAVARSRPRTDPSAAAAAVTAEWFWPARIEPAGSRNPREAEAGGRRSAGPLEVLLVVRRESGIRRCRAASSMAKQWFAGRADSLLAANGAQINACSAIGRWSAYRPGEPRPPRRGARARKRGNQRGGRGHSPHYVPRGPWPVEVVADAGEVGYAVWIAGPRQIVVERDVDGTGDHERDSVEMRAPRRPADHLARAHFGARSRVPQRTTGVPRKLRKKTGFSVASLICCIPSTSVRSSASPRPGITETDA